ncbi:tRNA uridine-5-carboxymethylaminomethyl(34) synthesis GTPase MnmE [Reinekea thalattae]|uniref:tRNA modification GTPase MnmE n=1 Tax=Reinekea thalattae TaxID=2593301 RepID=A0A5C8ZC22_9GAMM|nr:tRNA uridine-5-carboxymethylaminomethyl(34) synthesis GTPase MnmE [Reinekea thalattae]TXR54721.1 tRNA uridine-5-carboxymethylaminomethyl(34) synthesis GTPase MnmE [Reinekea thalattae]
MTKETIAAVATAPGRGGVGIVRVSGPAALSIAEQILKHSPKPRYAHYGEFYDTDGAVIDEGISLYFPGPNSFTGEDVVEFQGHGGPVILELLLESITQQGCRLARPGEFSERAFLNDKMDLAQAEAIADLIDASSKEAARSAVRSLKGVFSKQIHQLVEQLIQLRIYVEAAIDFPEEEIDFLSDGKVEADLVTIIEQLERVKQAANQGQLMREGMRVVIAGRPNAGKSSLLNALAGHERAIVTDIAGTTRDVLKEHIHIDGMPLHLIDTAGLRDAPDVVEKIGVERAWEEIATADRILFLVDAKTTDETDPAKIWPDFIDRLPPEAKITVIRNKIDMTVEQPGIDAQEIPVIRLSAKQGLGVDDLKQHLKQLMGFEGLHESGFIARKRHLDALSQAEAALQNGLQQLQGYSAGELLAEDLKFAQNALNEITGEFSSDDLLGRIFSSFCIGK